MLIIKAARESVTGAVKRRPALLAVARQLTLPIVRKAPVDRMPAALGSLHEISLPRGLPKRPAPSPSGGANINLLLRFVSETRDVPGDIAQCGVYKGGTLIPLGLHVRQQRIPKTVFGFDSFTGFDADDVRSELSVSELTPDRDRNLRSFTDTSLEKVRANTRRLRLEPTVELVKGFFKETLPRYGERQFSFVHLDCDLYQAYADCLAFFYPRLAEGAVVLFDEYNDPPWPGCNKAVDEFLADKPEKPVMAESDNYQKWYFRRGH
jgi:hypothetical protein